jgi:predicted peroxiredoxin
MRVMSQAARPLIDRCLIASPMPNTGTRHAKLSGRATRINPLFQRSTAMPKVTKPANQKGDFLVDYEEKVFEDVKAEKGEKALVTFDTSILLYGPGVTLGVKRGFPTLGDEAFPGHQNFNNQITKFIAEGGKVYACRFALQALYGHGEGSLIEGIRPISPLDVLDIILLHRKDNAFILDTWTL